ncbi:uncharacterized protein LOC102806109, partial [Saccoglossus kowalevskii]|uniref:Uncharacterized protein LOC102806109 n=1 Tax=Saccoglossus kowalevskii TaxID=10224 RepID=A0ABM0MQN1_SACKO
MKILASETNDNGIPNTADMQINSQNSNLNLKKVIPDAEVLTPEKTEVKLGNFMNDKIKRGRENKKRDMQDADKMELKDIKAKDVINRVDDKVKLKSNKLSNILLKRDGYSEKINKVKSENHFQRRLLDVGEDGDISSQRKQLSKLLESFSLGYESPDTGNHDNSLDIDTVTTIDSGNVNNQDESTESTEADLEDDLPLPLSSLHTRQQDASNNHQEELLYDAQWKILQKYFRNSDANFNLLTYGGEHQSLLGAKVAHMYPNSTVVTVIPPLLRMRKIIEKHRKLQQSLSLYNNLLINRPFTSETVYNMHRMPEFFRFQVLGLPVFNQIASMGHYFSQYLGRLLSMAKTTFIEVPSPSQLVLADILLGNHTEVEKNGPSVYK